jgi:signal transduction protein with GAF and PtsI domain
MDLHMAAEASTAMGWADDLVDRLDRSFLYQHCAVFVDDGSGQHLRIAAQRWGPEEELGAVRPGEGTVPVNGSIVGRAFMTAEPVFLPDAAVQPDHRTHPGAQPRSEIAVPIMVNGRAVGVINVESARLGAYGIADLDLLLEHAEAAAALIPR